MAERLQSLGQEWISGMHAPAFLVKARRMPRQAHRNKQQGKQEKTKKANRFGSCRLLAKKVGATNFEWTCFSQTIACRSCYRAPRNCDFAPKLLQICR